MALQRKPVKTDVTPSYPAAQEYANDRRSFLVKLGITAAGLLGLAGCGEATNVQPQTNIPTSTSTPPPKWPVFNAPVTPQTAMPGAPPPPTMTNTSAPPPPGNATTSTAPAPAPSVPQACTPGGISLSDAKSLPQLPQASPAPARPAAATGGEPVPPEMIQPAPAKKEEK